jgi:hypothetical protein
MVSDGICYAILYHGEKVSTAPSNVLNRNKNCQGKEHFVSNYFKLIS